MFGIRFRVFAGLASGPRDAGRPDIGITLDDGLTEVSRGDLVAYVLEITNHGEDRATGIAARFDLPAYCDFLSAAGGGTFAAGQVHWPAASLEAGESFERRVSIKVRRAAPLAATSLVARAGFTADTGAGPDPNTANEADGGGAGHRAQRRRRPRQRPAGGAGGGRPRGGRCGPTKDEKTAVRPPEFPALVGYDDAVRFASRHGWRLPTEAEWEFSCRGGTTSLFVWGDQVPPDEKLSKWLSWDLGNRGEVMRNDFGLGGLFFGEWTSDKFAPDLREDSVATDSQVIKGGGTYFWPWQDEE